MVEDGNVAVGCDVLKNNDTFPSPSLSEEHIATGTSQRSSCRFVEIKNGDQLTILDSAHNPSAMKTLVAKLEAIVPRER